jgi:pyruvate dehydrogenase E2 component (dihydrolipoamide acetyltransferase)
MSDFLQEMEKYYAFRSEKAAPVRKVIARRMVESKQSIPHFYLIDEIAMDETAALRRELNEQVPADASGNQAKVSFNDMVVRAASLVLRDNPRFNIAYVDGSILYFEQVSVGIAVAVEGALLVPVIRECGNKDVYQIGAAARELAGKARSGKLRFTDSQGGTITVSNLGMYGIKGSLSIINPPQAMILTVGAIKQMPVVREGRVEPGLVMMVTLSCDHRAVDGALGSEFLTSFKDVLQAPRQHFP